MPTKTPAKASNLPFTAAEAPTPGPRPRNATTAQIGPSATKFKALFGSASSNPGTPLDAIRRKCLECVGGSRLEVERCLAADNGRVCKLHGYLRRRLGRGGRVPGIYRAIKEECKACVGSILVRDREQCKCTGCALWPWRFGTAPKTAERRGHVVQA